MPKHIFENAQVTLNSVDITAELESVELMGGKRTGEVSALGDTFEQHLVVNLRRWAARLNFLQNYSTSGAYATLKTIFDSTASSGVQLTLRPTTAARSATNPDLQGQVAIDGDFPMVAGTFAEAHKGNVGLKGLGNLSILTTSS